MSSKKIVAVFGATGNQGGSVARSLLKNKDFSVRAITRNPDSDAAKALAEHGAEVVKANGLDKEEMKAALKGAWGTFVNTPSEDPSINQPEGPNEFDLGKNIMDAAAEVGVENIAFSGGADTETLTNGEVHCRMMMQANKIIKYARTLPQFTNVISVDCGWYLENFLSAQVTEVFGGFPLHPDAEGYLTLALPRWGSTPERVPFIAVAEDYGDIVHGVFLDPSRYHGKLVQAVSDIRSFADVVASFEGVVQGTKKARLRYLDSVDQFETYGDQGLQDVADMFRFLQKVGGMYFDGEVTDGEVARRLKAEVVKAVGGEDAELVTLEAFFGKHYAGKK